MSNITQESVKEIQFYFCTITITDRGTASNFLNRWHIRLNSTNVCWDCGYVLSEGKLNELRISLKKLYPSLQETQWKSIVEALLEFARKTKPQEGLWSTCYEMGILFPIHFYGYDLTKNMVPPAPYSTTLKIWNGLYWQD